VSQHSSRRGVAAVVIVTTLAIAACGGGGSSGSNNASSSGSSSSSSSKPVPGGKVVYGLEADTAGGFCLPDAQLAISGIQVVRAVYDTLMIQGAKPSEYKPYLAKSLTPNADFTEWTITLRPGIKFHDGSDLTATVVKNNLDAFRGTQESGHLALLLRFVFENIKDTAVVDPLTVKVTMKKAWVDFPGYLWGSGRVGIAAQAQLDDKKTCDKNLIGTGPFKLSAPITNTQDIDLVKNAAYWQKDADGVQLPYLDGIEFRAIPEESQRLSSLQNGTINMMHDDFGETIAQLRQLKEAGTVSLTESEKQTEVGYILLNSQSEPFNQLAAREAVAYAFDDDKYNQLQNAGILKHANGPFSPDNPGYVADTGYPKFNLDTAKQKVAEYKTATGKDLAFTLTTTNEAVTVRGAQIVQQFMKDAGITVTLSSEDQTSLINDAVGGKIQAFGWRNHPGGDPDGQYLWWHSSFAATTNFGKINDPEVDRLLDLGRVTADPAAREKAYEDLNKVLGSKVYNVWEYWIDWTIGTAPDVHGIYGPDLPDGGGPPNEGLAVGHPVLGLYIAK
jgi:peptide/nickel transport system substrate-binding protein